MYIYIYMCVCEYLKVYASTFVSVYVRECMFVIVSKHSSKSECLCVYVA